jgi:hypothetical protein
MRRARFKIIVFVTTLAAVAVILATPTAALRFGPRAILGLAALPLHMLGHGVFRGVPHHRLARAAVTAHAQVSERTRPPHEDQPPASPPHPTIVARVDPQHAVPQRGAAPMPPWPAASPSVYEDLLGYVLWPKDYADQLWTHGYGDIMNALLTPAANAEQAASLIQNGMCSAKARDLADRLIAHTRETIEPDEAQQAALEELGAAVRQAIERGRTAVCAGTGDPQQRMVDGLWTMWDATLLMRPPLEKLYASLSDAQKAKLAGEASAAAKLARACAEQHPPESMPGAGEAQRLTLETLRAHSAELVKLLAGSCPRGSEPTPLDRLDAARERMNTLLYVVMSMSPTVNELRGPRQSEPGRPAASH